jgi:hypothetical protein
LTAPFYVKDIIYGGSSILHKSFLPGKGDEKLRITIGRDSGTISARVTGSNGLPATGAAVLILPAVAQSEGELGSAMIAGLTDDSGFYSASTVPPGRYHVMATNDPPPGRVFHGEILMIDLSPETLGKLMRLRSRGQLVEVSSGNNLQVSLSPKALD